MNSCKEPVIHLVDDDVAVRDSLKTLLESYGMLVRDYSSATDFLRDLNADTSGCLLLDLHLPVVSGFDLIGIMEQCRIGLPVVFITGRSDRETKARAMKAGAIAFLDKPVGEDALIAAIHGASAAGQVACPAAPLQGRVSAAVQNA